MANEAVPVGEAGSAAPPERPSGVARAVLVLALVMAGASVAQAFGRFTYGVLLPEIRDDLLGSNRAAGTVGTLNVAAYLVGTLAVAAASRRVGLVSLVRVGMCLSTAGLLLASTADSALALDLAVVAMGLGGAAIWIPSPRLAAAALPPKRRGLAAGLVGMGIGIGIVFAGWLADALRATGGDASWREVYRVEGVIGVVVLVAVLAVLRDPPLAPGHEPSQGGALGGVAALRRIDGWWQLVAAYAAFGFMYLLTFAFLVARLEDDSGFSASEASSMFALVGLAAVFGGVVLGPVSDRVGRRGTLVGGFAAFSVSVLAVLVGDQPWVLLGAVGVGASFSGIPSVIAAYVVDATDAHTYGPVYSVATLAFGIAQVAAPQVGGILADWQGSFTSVLLLSAAVAVVGAGLSWQLPAHRHDEVPAPEPIL